MPKRQLPQSVEKRIAEFLEQGRYGRIEIDVADGNVVVMRIVESFKPDKDECNSSEPMAA